MRRRHALLRLLLLLPVALALLLVSAPADAALRVHIRHRHKQRDAASGAGSSSSSAETTLRTTCPPSTELPLQPTLTTDCPFECGDNMAVCILYPGASRSNCATAGERTCYEGDGCAYECLRTPLERWFITLYDDGAVVQEVLDQNVALPDEESNYINTRVVSAIGAFVAPDSVDFVSVTGNEAANNYDSSINDEYFMNFYSDTKFLPAGDVVNFTLPPTFFDGLLDVYNLRLENIAFPANVSEDIVFSQINSLWLRNTLLKELPFDSETIVELEILDVSVNHIETIRSESLPESLLILNISDNIVHHIEKGSLPETLSTLDLTSNRVTEIAPGTLPATLTVLYLEGNQLTSIPEDIADMTELEQLTLKSNPLKSIPDDSIPTETLQVLDLSNCSLKDIPPSIGSMGNLSSLSLDDNDLSKATRFSSLPSSLAFLSLQRCGLAKLPPSISKLNLLDIIYVDGNPTVAQDLSALPANVTTISVSDSGLETFPLGLKKLSQLYYLFSENNPLRQLQPGLFPQTELTLSISNASFEEIPSGVFPSTIEELFIRSTPLRKLPDDIVTLSALGNLTLSGCALESVNGLQNISSLRRLDLSRNRIRSIEGRFSRLEFLDLRENGLESFRVAESSRLKTLQLSSNNLSSVPSSVFGMKSLVVLNLTANPITNFTPTVEQYAFLKNVPVLVMDQSMFASACESKTRLDTFEICSPGSSSSPNVTVIHQKDDNSLKKKSGTAAAWLIALNAFLGILLAVALFVTWRTPQGARATAR
ncbi:hypothetical protein PINS_up022904 [Pythium insidiosum]|nr:hypothetical protein PINS_up022904 [Pythium insidiosum]